jgi:hypothetical protein
MLTGLLIAASVKNEDEYGLYHYNFDDDPLIAQCSKPKPLMFSLMFDFLTMVKGESGKAMQKCVTSGDGPGFTSPPGVARNIFAMTTMAYNTYARYSQHANPVTVYHGWRRMPQGQENVPDCAYIYGFYRIVDYLMPERLVYERLKEKYEKNYGCNLEEVSAGTNSDLGWVQRDVNALISNLKNDGFNQAGCFADTTNFR